MASKSQFLCTEEVIIIIIIIIIITVIIITVLMFSGTEVWLCSELILKFFKRLEDFKKIVKFSHFSLSINWLVLKIRLCFDR